MIFSYINTKITKFIKKIIGIFTLNLFRFPKTKQEFQNMSIKITVVLPHAPITPFDLSRIILQTARRLLWQQYNNQSQTLME